MFSRMAYTWQIMKASWDVLRQDTELLIFPLLSGIAGLLVTASFAVPMVLTGTWEPPARDADIMHQIAYYGVVFLFYLCGYFVVTFFNSAIVGAAVMRLSGENSTFNDAMGTAMRRLPQIAGWSLVAATVGLILRIIEDRSEKVGQIVAGLLGTAWSITTFLVVPVLVVEGKGPIDAFKKSTGLLRKTWGDQIVGNFGFGAIFFLLSLPAFLCIAGAIYVAAALNSLAIAIAIGAVAVLYLMLLGIIQSALQAIFQAAVYVYAAHGTEPEAFSGGLLSGAMGHK